MMDEQEAIEILANADRVEEAKAVLDEAGIHTWSLGTGPRYYAKWVERDGRRIRVATWLRSEGQYYNELVGDKGVGVQILCYERDGGLSLDFLPFAITAADSESPLDVLHHWVATLEFIAGKREG